MSLLSAQDASASVVTKEKCWALHLQRDRFQEVVVTYPQVLEYVSDLADKRTTQNAQLRVQIL